ncbi:hypothetical protein D3C87_1320900 [compost metagenome]
MAELAHAGDGRRNRQDHPRRNGLIAQECVVDQEAVNTAVPVAHRVEVDEPKCDGGRARQRLTSAGHLLEGLQPCQHLIQHREMRADIVDDVLAHGGLADEHRRLAHTQPQCRGAENVLLQHDQAVGTQRLVQLAAVFTHNVGKTLHPICLVGLVLNLEASPRLLELEPDDGAPQHVFAKLVVQFRERLKRVELQRLSQDLRATNDGAKSWRARQVVVDPPTTIASGFGARDVGIIGDGINVGSAGQIRDIKLLTGEPFIEKSSPARILSERLGSAPFL